MRVRTPECWVTRYDEADQRCVLVMEDLAQSAQGDQFDGCSPGQVPLVIEQAVAYAKIRQQFEPVWIGEEVLRMNLEPSHGWSSGHHLRNVRKPKADTGPFSYGLSGVIGDGHVPSPRYFG